MMLDWPKSFDIINGIARGLLYLHHVGLLSVQHNPADRPSMPATVAINAKREENKAELPKGGIVVVVVGVVRLSVNRSVRKIGLGGSLAARPALGGWAGILGGLGLFSVPNPEDEAAETEENKSKLELIEKRNGCDFDCNLRPLRVQASCSF
ncbi:hypothetical protein L3X38_013040 [Prunus dulcis]|uniref:Uncharacterized protein n=1 Tax=Prunus dulcis TaxID=3755 RepID=A0AAD4WL80_PRUDU|nr:hypothetical protein L3X38_013040 [Prunus dulcis]